MLNYDNSVSDISDLDLVFNTNLPKNEEDKIFFRNLKRLALGGLCAAIMGVVFPLKEYQNTDKSSEFWLGLVVAGNAIRYAIRGGWLFLSLDREFSLRYQQQQISEENKYSKVARHFLSITFGFFGFLKFLYDAYYAETFVTQELLIFFFIVYSARNIYGYYLFFNLKNDFYSSFFDKYSQSSRIVKHLLRIIDEATPVLLNMTQGEREALISEIYSSSETRKVSLFKMIKQLHSLKNNDTQLAQGYLRCGKQNGYSALGLSRDKTLNLLLNKMMEDSENIENLLSNDQFIRIGRIYYDIRNQSNINHTSPTTLKAIASLHGYALDFWTLNENDVLVALDDDVENRIALLETGIRRNILFVNNDHYERLVFLGYENEFLDQTIRPLNTRINQEGISKSSYNKYCNSLFYFIIISLCVLYAVFYPVVLYGNKNYFTGIDLFFSLTTIPSSFGIELMLSNRCLNKIT